MTITDVAKRAGVHYTTVSMALRNHPRLPAATRERLRALAEEMGYRPDPVLRALMDYRGESRRRTHIATVAYITNWDTRWGWQQSWSDAEIFAGAERRTSELGYQTEHFWLGDPGVTHKRLSHVLYSRGIVGLIIASHRHETEKPLELEWSKFSAVKVDFVPQQPAVHNVSNDRHATVRLAVTHALGRGYRRIGFAIHPQWDASADLAWTYGFLAAQRLIPPADRVPVFESPELVSSTPAGASDQLASRAAFEDWFRRYQPDVLVSSSPFVMPHLEAMGLSIPRDIGFIDLFLRESPGKVAGVRQNWRRVGEAAVDILTDQLRRHALGIPEIPTLTLVEGTWFDGASLPLRDASEKSVAAPLLGLSA